MSFSRLVRTAIGVGLATALAALSSPAPALATASSAATVASSTTASPAAAGRTARAASGTPFVPCPIVKVPPVGVLPSPSPLPVRDRALPTIGGEGLATAGLAVPSGAPSLPGTLSATSWIVADLDTGAVLGACGPHEYGAPASLQKLLLAATVLPKLDPTHVVTVTAEDTDFEPGSSAVGLLKGGKYTVETLWLGLFLNSGNDAANVLARLGGGGGTGGVAATLAAMDAEAARRGALDTHAETPSGLDGPGQVTSAYDLALIARALFAREDFSRYVTTMSAQIPAQPQLKRRGFQIQNDNRLMREYAGALGGKTGFTDIARHTYVGAAARDGRRLVAALLGAETRPVRAWAQAAALLDWGFALPSGASVGRLVAPGEAEQVLAAASPSPAASAGPLSGGAATGSAPTPVLVGVAATAVVFTVVWLTVMLPARRARARHRAAPPATPLQAPSPAPSPAPGDLGS
jgi:D-alanyl-D-alanine carboxypeptidase (penicillin-binding protein 5/6)